MLACSFVGVVLLYAVQRLQPALPLSLDLPAVDPALAFNTAAASPGSTCCSST